MDEMTTMEARKLEAAVERGDKVRLFTINGYQITGLITDFDCNALLIRNQAREMLVYRHAISTIYLDT